MTSKRGPHEAGIVRGVRRVTAEVVKLCGEAGNVILKV